MRCNHPALARAAAEVAVRAESGLAPARRWDLDLLMADDALELRQEGRLVARRLDLDQIILDLHHLVDRLMLEEAHAQAIKLHAACGAWLGRRLVLAGDQGAGKTTLGLSLLLAGAELFCDDRILLSPKSLQPYPRRFYLKESTLDLLPALRPTLGGRGVFRHPRGPRFYFWDPTDLGRAWRTPADWADAVFYLQPDFGGRSRLEACPKYEMARLLMFQCARRGGDTRDLLRAVTNLVNSCRCYLLTLGEVAHGPELVRRGLEAEPERPGHKG